MATIAKSGRTKKQSGHLARNLGELCERMAEAYMRWTGNLVQRIATPCSVIRGRKVYTGKVIGDIVGCTPEGRALLVECKCHADGKRPVLSDFRPHQVAALKAWHMAGAKVMVAWLDSDRKLQIVEARSIMELR